MTAEAQTFTHLESLLLFQSVAAYGNTADSFARISNALKNSELLQRSAENDNDRLNPQALTELYLRLLKSEAKRALQNAEPLANQDAKKAEAANPSRRVEVPSPKIATIEDADKHRHLEPQMINRLYDLYKDQVIQEITEEEQKYDQLVGQVKSLESQLKSEDVNVDAGSIEDVADASSALPNANQQPPRESSKEGKKADGQSPLSADAVPNHRTPDESKPATVKQAQDISSKTQPPPKLAKTLAQQRVSEILKPPSLTPANDLEVPVQQNVSNASYDMDSIPPSPRRKRPRPTLGSSEITTPESSTDNDIQDDDQKPGDTVSTHPLAQHEEVQPDLVQPLHGKQAPSSLRHQSSSSANRSGGMQLPPFQVSPQAPHQSQQAHTGKQAFGQQPLPRQVKSVQELEGDTTPATKSSVNNLETPSSIKQVSSRGSLIKGGQGTFSTPGSDTKWKVVPGMADVPLPRPRSISPLSDDAASPGRAEKQTPSRHQRAAAAGSVRETRRSKATRAISRTPSIAQSTQGRTRSQSVMSNADDAHLQSAHGADKHEVSTPNTETQPSPRQTRATRNTIASAAMTSNTGKRKRAPTLNTDTVGTPASNSIPPSPTPGPLSTQRRTLDKEAPNTITASRNFHKTSAPMLNNIGSHKHASLFSNPVSSRTAGYYDIIKRPTDLSSIRKAIAAGVKAVNSAAISGAAGSPSVSTPSAASGEAGGTVTLPISRELVPPEGIVNGAQLEQEVMRMFANAVMFNEGDDGVVADTREMFDDTEKTIAAWKAAETGKEWGDEAGVGDDSAIASSAKRRRA